MSVEVYRPNKDRTELLPVGSQVTRMSNGHLIITIRSEKNGHLAEISALHRERVREYAIENDLPRLNREEPLVGRFSEAAA